MTKTNKKITSQANYFMKLFFFFFCVLSMASMGKSFAVALDCQLTNAQVLGIESFVIKDHVLILNDEFEIPLEKSRVKCGHYGEQVRFDGYAYGYQIILKSCSTEVEYEGDLIDSINWVGSEVHCHKVSLRNL